MRAAPYKYVLIIILLIFVVTFASLRLWQGPKLMGYVISSMPLVQRVVATGRVVRLSRTQIGSEITALAIERHVQEGDHVQQDEVLLVLRSDVIAAEVRQADAALKELSSSRQPQSELVLANAKIQLAQAERELLRRRDLTERSLLSTEALEQAEQSVLLAQNMLKAATLSASALAPGGVEELLLRERLAALQAQLAKTVVRSEVNGTVLTRNVEPGDIVQPGRVLFTIALDGNTELLVPFDERNLSRLALQQTAVVIADAYADKPFPARINFIAPSIDPQRGTVEVRLAVDPVPEFLRQDMTVSVNVETARRERTVTIPNDALSAVQGDQAQVLLLNDGKLQRRQITLGLRGLAMSEVLVGLRDGDKVLADGSSSLTEGTRVRLTLHYNQPGSNQPGSNQPSSNQPGSNQPSSNQPSNGIDDSGSRNEVPVSFN